MKYNGGMAEAFYIKRTAGMTMAPSHSLST